MNLNLFGSISENEKKKAIYSSDKSFNLINRNSNVIKNLIKSIGQEYCFSIDDKEYNLESLFVVKININSVGAIYVVLENRHSIKTLSEEVSVLKDLPIETIEQRKEKTLKALQLTKKYSPIMYFANSYIPFITEQVVNGVPVLMKNNPKDSVELSRKKKNDAIIDRLFAILIPAFVTLFIYLAFNLFSSAKYGLGVVIIISLIFACGVYCYDLLWIYKGKISFVGNEKTFIYIYGFNAIGVTVGTLLSFLATFILKSEEGTVSYGEIIFLVIGIAIAVVSLCHILTALVLTNISFFNKKKIDNELDNMSENDGIE